jgi:hypothetical protein
MSVEANSGALIGTVNRQDRLSLLIRTGEPVVKRWIERVTAGTSIELPDGFYANFQEVIEQGCFLLVIGPHKSLYGGLALSEFGFNLTAWANRVLPEVRKLKGLLLPLSSGLAHGGLGKKEQAFFDLSAQSLDKRHLKPVLMTRSVDETKGEKYNMIQFTRNMRQGIQDGYRGIVVFPEGTVQSGRRNKNGERNGMQELQEGCIAFMSSLAGIKEGQEIAVIPVGMRGEEEVYDPAINRPHVRVIAAGLGLGSTDGTVRINVGEIIRSTDPRVSQFFANIKNADNAKALDNFFGRKIAELLPPEQRGFYA